MVDPDTRVKDIMATAVTTLGRNDTLDLADDAMALGRIRHLPVLDAGRVVGVVSQRDLFRTALAAALGFGTQAQRRILKTLLVKEVMSEPAITVSQDAPVREAARTMVERKIGCLPALDGEGRLVGIITETDVLRQVMNG